MDFNGINTSNGLSMLARLNNEKARLELQHTHYQEDNTLLRADNARLSADANILPLAFPPADQPAPNPANAQDPFDEADRLSLANARLLQENIRLQNENQVLLTANNRLIDASIAAVREYRAAGRQILNELDQRGVGQNQNTPEQYHAAGREILNENFHAAGRQIQYQLAQNQAQPAAPAPGQDPQLNAANAYHAAGREIQYHAAGGQLQYQLEQNQQAVPGPPAQNPQPNVPRYHDNAGIPLQGRELQYRIEQNQRAAVAGQDLQDPIVDPNDPDFFAHLRY
jgi:hypothetical protein